MDELVIKAIVENIAGKVLAERTRTDEAIAALTGEVEKKVGDAIDAVTAIGDILKGVTQSLSDMDIRVNGLSEVVASNSNISTEAITGLREEIAEQVAALKDIPDELEVTRQSLASMTLVVTGIEADVEETKAFGAAANERMNSIEDDILEQDKTISSLKEGDTEIIERLDKIDGNIISCATASDLNDVRDSLVVVLGDEAAAREALSEHLAEIKSGVLKEIDATNERILDFDDRITSVRKDVDDVVVRFEERKGEVDAAHEALDGKIEGLETGHADAASVLKQLDLDVQTLGSDVSDLSKLLDKNYNAISEKQIALAEKVDDNAEALSEQIVGIKESFLKEAVAAEEASDSLAEGVTAIRNDVSELTARLDENSTDIIKDIMAISDKQAEFDEKFELQSKYTRNSLDTIGQTINSQAVKMADELASVRNDMTEMAVDHDNKLAAINDDVALFKSELSAEVTKVPAKVVVMLEGSKKLKGEPGPPGPQGEKGADGADGAGITAQVWTPGVHREGTIVQHDHGRFSKALRDTSLPPGSDDWKRIGTLGFAFTGVKDAAREYDEGDLFLDEGSLFLMTGGKVKMVTKRGKDGATGRSIKGDKGDRGPSIIECALFGDKATFVLEDGEMIEADASSLLGAAVEKAKAALIKDGLVIAEIGDV